MARLSDREREVIVLAGQGLVDKAIAKRLDISPHTVRVHLERARMRLGASNRAHAVVLALLYGTITLDELR